MPYKYKPYLRRKRKYTGKSTKSKRTTKSRFTRPTRRIKRRTVRRRAVARVPRLIGDLQYRAKRPLRFTTKVNQLITWRVTPEVSGNGCKPSIMYINATDFSNQISHDHGAWQCLHKTYLPSFFKQVGEMYNEYRVLGAKMTVTVKPLIGNNEDITPAYSAGAPNLRTFFANQNKPNVQSEGIMLCTVGLTPDKGTNFPSPYMDCDQLIRAPNCKSHRTIYKRQELMPKQVPTAVELGTGGVNITPGSLGRYEPTTGIPGKQMSFTSTYSPKRLYGQRAQTDGYLKVQMQDEIAAKSYGVHSSKSNHFFIDIREFQQPINPGEWSIVPDVIVTAKIEYCVMIADLENQQLSLNIGENATVQPQSPQPDLGNIEEPQDPSSVFGATGTPLDYGMIGTSNP